MATAETIPLLLERARVLRNIRSACRQFVALGVEASSNPGADFAAVGVAQGLFDSSDEANLADPHNFDWSLLYRGSVLDD